VTGDLAQSDAGRGGIRWRLPRIVAMEALRVRYSPPAYHVIERELRPVSEAIEIVIQTEEPIPERALAPVLFVGDEELTESEPAGYLRYRFFGFYPDRLKESAELALGWTMANSPRVQSELRFRLQGDVRKEGGPTSSSAC
jgi:hypothetical protein